MGRKLTVLVAITAMMCGYVFYTAPRFPPTASHRWLKSLTGVYLHMMTIMGAGVWPYVFSQMHVGPYIGLGDPYNLTRALFEIPARVLDVGVSATVETERTTMDGVEVLIFRPRSRSKELLPGIMLYHGGGWVLGSPDTYAPVSRKLVETTHSILVSVHYRRAPEHTFPIPFEDCLRATKYLLRNAEKYGMDKNKIGVKGDSAGGNIAMAVALSLTANDESSLPSIAFLGLNYAVLQMLDYSLPSYVKHADGPGLCTKEIAIKYALLYAFGNFTLYEMFRDNNHVSKQIVESDFPSYVNSNILPEKFRHDVNEDEEAGDRPANSYKGVRRWPGPEYVPREVTDVITDWRYSPLMATDEQLKRLPPTYIMNAEFDVLRDEGLILAERIRKLGGTVEHSYYPSEQHGFLNLFRLNHYGLDEIVEFARFFNKTVRP